MDLYKAAVMVYPYMPTSAQKFGINWEKLRDIIQQKLKR